MNSIPSSGVRYRYSLKTRTSALPGRTCYVEIRIQKLLEFSMFPGLGTTEIAETTKRQTVIPHHHDMSRKGEKWLRRRGQEAGGRGAEEAARSGGAGRGAGAGPAPNGKLAHHLHL
ncbi:hypothetical protein EVAR_99954_1 [Eumeta japonica]|uniref:Uncharacterized protein n=1 Tax=Eumeta variegata TaxID=151549 RepID=A0A4C1ZIG5_EUMVA|nr:hypothetical protein EVAR_99954_1 [Eumeta japonica]